MIKSMTLFAAFSCISWGVSASCDTSSLSPIVATTPTENFIIDTSAEVVTDKTTGLMWKMCMEGMSGSDCRTGSGTQATYLAALQSVATLNSGAGFAGFTDWRLPNLKELRTIVEEKCSRPALNQAVFPPEKDINNPNGSASQNIISDAILFTSTPTSYFDLQDIDVWVVDFSDGSFKKKTVGGESGSDELAYYRLVRDAR